MARNVVARALLVLIGAAVVLVAVISGPAQAAPSALIERDGEPVVMTVNGRAVVEAGEVVDDVWVANGSAAVGGRVEGSVIILNGNANVAGSVGGDVIVVRGGASIGPEAVVEGDVRASSTITRADGAIVDGSIEQGSVVDGLLTLVPMVRAPLWVGLTIALLALGVAAIRLAGDAVDNARNRMTSRPLGSAMRGLALLVLLPLLALVSLATIVGGLLSLLLLAIVALAGLAGLVVVAKQIGRWMLPRKSSALRAFLLGAVILRVLALVPFIGALTTVLAAMLGAGALLMARHEATDGAEHDDADATVGPDAAAPDLATDATSATGPNLDLRNGTPVVDARADRLMIDLLGETAPRPEPERHDPGPEVLASLPVREHHFADDPQEAPGNGMRRALFADTPNGAPAGAGVSPPPDPGVPVDAGGPRQPLFTEPDPTRTPSPESPVQVDTGSYRGPLFSSPEPERDPDSADGDAATGDADVSIGDLFGRGARAWRPSRN